MKRALAILLTLLLCGGMFAATNNFGPSGNSLTLGMAYDDGTAATFTPDSAYTFWNAGDAIGIRFCAPASQTNGALKLYMWCTAIANTPEYTATLRESASAEDDTDVPDDDAALLATSDEITPSALDWEVFTFASASLTAGQSYWLIVANTDLGNEATDTATWATRGAADGHGIMPGTAGQWGMSIVTATDGFANGAPTVIGTVIPPVVIAFAGGTVLGNPYVADSAAHANNQNYRGNAFKFPGKVSAGGLAWAQGTASMSKAGIYAADGSAMVEITLDQTTKAKAGCVYFAPTDLTGGTTYYAVTGYSANSTAGMIYTMGEAVADVPADVLAARPYGVAYVDAAATADLAASADASKICSMALILADIPVASAGTGHYQIIIISGVPISIPLEVLWAVLPG